jgi:uncharacterized alpha-E superfamily protein
MGAAAATMSRDLAYSFLEIGRLIERADMTTRVLDVQAGILIGPSAATLEPYTDLTWGAMLKSLGAEQAYRRQMGGVISARKAVRFLLRDPAFPRSVEHCLVDISRWLMQVPFQAAPANAAGSASFLLSGYATDELDLNGLHQFVDDLQLAFGELHDQLEASYFPTRSEGGR